MGNFKTIKAWQYSKELAVNIYKITSSGKFAADYGLRDQIRRAAVSIPSNIAEGDDSGSNKQSIRFFNIAKGSVAEVYTQLIISYEISYIDKEPFEFFEDRCKHISAMITNLIRARRAWS